MSNVIRLKKGLDIKLEGTAQKQVSPLPRAESYAVKPDDFKGFTPKLLVKQDDAVKAGTPLLFDKYRPEIVVTSPVSGKVAAINRGEKRRILEVVVVPDGETEYESYDMAPLKNLSKHDVTSLMLSSGLWCFLIQRPYGIIADPGQNPKAVFISGFDSAPLAPDMNFVLRNEADNLNAGIEALSKLTTGKVHIGLHADDEAGVTGKVRGAQFHYFKGPHPAGNVGVQIHHVDPIVKGDVVWTMDIQNVAILGRFFRTGKVDMSRTIAVTGSEVIAPRYHSVIGGASIRSIIGGNVRPQMEGYAVRIISGNVLTGTKVEENGYMGFYSNQITVIPEGNKYEFLGWIAPRFSKFSVSRSYFSWLTPNKTYNLDTNMNGSERPFVVTGLYDRYLPMDIYPMYLLKAILAEDLEKMENLGIYEVIEEDLALCEFVDPSKTEMQAIVRRGIDQMLKELN